MGMTDGLSDLYLNFYGCIVKVSSGERACLDNARRDFFYFFCPQPPEKPLSVSIRLHREPAPPLPAQAKQVFQTNEGVCYQYEQIRYVDYSGKALAKYDFRSEEGVAFSLDDNLLHEISYIMILSRIGELLDRKGIHRLHSLAVSVDHSAIICLLPMGGGKTTLALELIKTNDCFLLSDEIAAIDGFLQVLPFPLRLGVRTTERIDPNMPGRHLRSITRIAYGPKVLIDVEYFMRKVASEPARLGVVLFGERNNFKKPELKRLSKFAALCHVLKYITFGYQLPQTKAYFFKFSVGYFITLFTILLSRILSGVKIALSVKCYRFNLADNSHENAQVMVSVLRKKGF